MIALGGATAEVHERSKARSSSSADVYFIRALANKVLHVAQGRITPCLGDYESYLHKTKSLSARAALTAGGGGVSTNKPAAQKQGKSDRMTKVSSQREEQKVQQRALAVQKKLMQQRVQRLEQEIEALEARRVELSAALEKPEVWQNGGRTADRSRDLQLTTSRLSELSEQWARDASQLEQLEEQRS